MQEMALHIKSRSISQKEIGTSMKYKIFQNCICILTILFVHLLLLVIRGVVASDSNGLLCPKLEIIFTNLLVLE